MTTTHLRAEAEAEAGDALTRALIDLASRGGRPRCGDSETAYLWTSDHDGERKQANAPLRSRVALPVVERGRSRASNRCRTVRRLPGDHRVRGSSYHTTRTVRRLGRRRSTLRTRTHCYLSLSTPEISPTAMPPAVPVPLSTP
jgi:hypothetical protein